MRRERTGRSRRSGRTRRWKRLSKHPRLPPAASCSTNQGPKRQIHTCWSGLLACRARSSGAQSCIRHSERSALLMFIVYLRVYTCMIQRLSFIYLLLLPPPPLCQQVCRNLPHLVCPRRPRHSKVPPPLEVICIPVPPRASAPGSASSPLPIPSHVFLHFGPDHGAALDSHARGEVPVPGRKLHASRHLHQHPYRRPAVKHCLAQSAPARNGSLPFSPGPEV